MGDRSPKDKQKKKKQVDNHKDREKNQKKAPTSQIPTPAAPVAA